MDIMECFRVYTQDINRDIIVCEASKRFPGGYSLFTGRGYWKGGSEGCVVIEVIGVSALLPTIERFAKDIKRLNYQEAVYITATELSTALLI